MASNFSLSTEAIFIGEEEPQTLPGSAKKRKDIKALDDDDNNPHGETALPTLPGSAKKRKDFEGLDDGEKTGSIYAEGDNAEKSEKSSAEPIYSAANDGRIIRI